MVTRKNINTMIKNGRTEDIILAHQINEQEKKDKSYNIWSLIPKMTYCQKEYAKDIARNRIKTGKETVFGLDKDLTKYFITELLGEWEAKRLFN